VARQDRQRLQKIPGIGKKTAERLLLELRDKALAAGAESAPAKGRRTVAGPGADDDGLRADAASALINLGYGKDVANRAVEQALETHGTGATLEAVLRAALGSLVR